MVSEVRDAPRHPAGLYVADLTRCAERLRPRACLATQLVAQRLPLSVRRWSSTLMLQRNATSCLTSSRSAEGQSPVRCNAFLGGAVFEFEPPGCNFSPVPADLPR
jgi:hypothetical protein